MYSRAREEARSFAHALLAAFMSSNGLGKLAEFYRSLGGGQKPPFGAPVIAQVLAKIAWLQFHVELFILFSNFSLSLLPAILYLW